MLREWLTCIALSIATLPAFAELKVGDEAPDFQLQATDGHSYRLRDFRGKEAVVLAWFPKAYTSGCTVECKSLAQHGDLLRRYQMSYFMASVDALPDNKGFAEKHQADFPLLSDPEKKVAKAYDVLTLMGFASRTTFYIGVDGKILAIDDDVRPQTSAEDMAATAERLGIAKRE